MFAEISSANIVGYQNNANLASSQVDYALAGGFTLISSGFKAVAGAKRGFWLSELKPQGYLENGDFLNITDGTSGDFNIQFIDDGGYVDPTKTYFWYHSFDTWGTGEWLDDGHWGGPNGDVAETGDAADLWIPAGESLYFHAPGHVDDEANPYFVTLNGEVVVSDYEYTFLPDGGFHRVANPFPVDVKLSTIIPEGYLENGDFLNITDGTSGDFNIQFIEPDGYVDPNKTYFWYHSFDTWGSGEWLEDGHWAGPDGDVTSDNDFTIKAGTGLYFRSPGHVDDDQNDYKIVIKSGITL